MTHPDFIQTVQWTFRLRWLLWAAGFASSGLLLIAYSQSKRGNNSLFRFFQPALKKIETVSNKHFRPILFLFAGAFIAAGWLEKYLQLITFQLNSQDFWLFEDMLRNITRGGLFLTRFAPQVQGIVQHGAVHSMFTWSAGLPLAWILGPTQAALLYGPLCLGLAAVFLALTARPKLGEFPALAFAIAFLFSTQVGKILEYDVHPEVAYPLFVFLWAWAMGLGDGKIRWVALLVATIGGIGIKEDSFLVFFPLLAWAVIRLRGAQRNAAIASSACSLVAYAVSVFAIGHFAKGSIGPTTWEGIAVSIPPGADLLKGIHWSSPEAFAQVSHALLADAGGFFGALQKFAHFWISRPWLSIVILAPWVLLQGSFYWAILPLSFAYALLKRAAILNLYYAAPFLGTFWLMAALSSRAQKSPRRFAAYALIAVCVFGDGGIELSIPSPQVRAISADASALSQSLTSTNHGFVQAPLLGIVPRSHVMTERLPSSLDSIDFLMFTPKIATYGVDPEEQRKLINRLSSSNDWKQVTLDRSENASVLLWVKKP